MRIERLKVHQFGRFSEHEICFHPGLNIIKGPNEAGKSTLHRAIMMALLGQPSQTKANERYRTWGSREWFRLEIEFFNSTDGPYRLLKDFNNRTQELVYPKGESVKTQDRIQLFLDSALGTSSSPIFESTVCVAQEELADLSTGQKEISHSLEGIITGGSDNLYAQDAIKKLKEKITEYNRGVVRPAPTNPGPIARLTTEKARLDQYIHTNKEKLAARDEYEQELITSRNRLNEIELTLNRKKSIKAAADKVFDLNRQLESLYQSEKVLDEKVDLINQANDEIALAHKNQQDIVLTTRLSSGDLEEINTLQTEIKRLSSSSTTRPLSYILPIITLILAIILGGVSIYLRDDITLFVILSMLCLGLSVFSVYRLITIRKQTVQDQGSINSPIFQDNDLQGLDRQLQMKLRSVGFSTVEELNMMLERASNARNTFENAQKRLRILLPDGKSVEDIKSERKKVSGDIRRIQEQLEEPSYQSVAIANPEHYHELAKDLSKLEQEREDLKERLQLINGYLAQETVPREQFLQAEEQLNVVEIELSRTRERLEIYKVAEATMKDAREATLSRASDKIAPRLGTYLSCLTLGRYGDVVVDNELNIRINHPSKPEFFIEPSYLSQGTQDQLYLAARLALVDLLFENANPPMFFDDPFVKFDPARLQAAITLCQKIAAEKQILLFTCSNNYDDAGHVITLPSFMNLQL